MTDKKPAKKASPFGTSNHTAAFSPPQASFGFSPPQAGKTQRATELGASALEEATTFDNNRSAVKPGQKTGKYKVVPKPKQRTPQGRVVPKPRTYGGVKQAPVIPGSKIQPTMWKQPPKGQSASSGYYKRVGGKNIWVPNKPAAVKPPPKPPAPPAKPMGPRAYSHAVKPGDSVWKIAAAHLGGNPTNAQVNAVKNAIIAQNLKSPDPNLRKNPNLIKPGQTIKFYA